MGKKTCIFVSYVQVFIVFTRLAHGAQLGDIIPTPGPCSMIPQSLFESQFQLPPLSLAPGSLPSLPGRTKPADILQSFCKPECHYLLNLSFHLLSPHNIRNCRLLEL